MVTGGSGFIGRHVVGELVARGSRVVALAENEIAGLPEAEWQFGDLARIVPRDIAGADLVIHLAARSGGIGVQASNHASVFSENQMITQHVLQASAAAHVPRVFLASSAVVYAPTDEDLTENHPLVCPADRPSGYAWSKVCDELLGRWYQEAGALEVTVGRFTNVYGPGGAGRGTVISDLCERALTLRAGDVLDVWGPGTALRSFVHVEDAARAVLSVASFGVPGSAYNIDSGEVVTIGHLAAMVRDRFAPGARLSFDVSRPSGVSRRVLDPSRLKALGMGARISLEEGLDGLATWARD